VPWLILREGNRLKISPRSSDDTSATGRGAEGFHHPTESFGLLCQRTGKEEKEAAVNRALEREGHLILFFLLKEALSPPKKEEGKGASFLVVLKNRERLYDKSVWGSYFFPKMRQFADHEEGELVYRFASE